MVFMHLHLVYLHKIIFIQEGIIMPLPLSGNQSLERIVKVEDLYKEVVENYHDEDFFDVMFFGRLDFSAEKAKLACERASLGDSLKATIKRLIPTRPNLSVSNDEIDKAIVEDMANEKGNIHTLSVYSNPGTADLYKTIAYAYDKEIVLSKTPIYRWFKEMIFTSGHQSVRLDSRIKQIKSISALRKESSPLDKAVLSFRIRWKTGGFQEINVTVTAVKTDRTLLTPDQRNFFRALNLGVEAIDTGMHKGKEGKVYAEVSENTDATEKDTVIRIVNKTAQQVREELKETYGPDSSKEILVANAANAYSTGGDTFGGGGGQEESLILDDPRLYAKLSTTLEDYYEDITEIRDKIEKYKENAANALAQIEICKDVENRKISNDLYIAISKKLNERTAPLKKDGDRAEFISDLLGDSSFKLKNKLIKEIGRRRAHINLSSPQVEKLAMDMLHRKSKGKVVIVPQPAVDFRGSDGTTITVPELKSGYAVFNAPDLRAIREYIASKVYEKISKMIADRKIESEKEIEDLINENAAEIKKGVQKKIDERVFNSIVYQTATVCKSAKGKYNYLILAAVGAGIFACPPETVARAFKHVLVDKKYKNSFKEIVFAILDKRGTIINAFERVFGVTAS